MRGIKTSLSTILALSLLAGATAGVAAQDEEADANMAPATFKVDYAGEPAENLEATSTETEYGASIRGAGIVDIPLEAGDPRASGLLTQVGNEEVLGNITATSGRVRIVNDDGAWEGTSTGFLRLKNNPKGGNPYNRAASIAILTGEDAYEGLTLVLTETLNEFQGYIIPTDALPPVPELTTE